MNLFARWLWCVLPLLFALTGCKTSFPPLPAEADFTVQEIGVNSFLIYYQGDSNAPEERVVDLALLRACRVAREHGFDYFAVVNPDHSTRLNQANDTATLYQDLTDGLVIKGYDSRPKRIFVFKPSTLEQMIYGKLNIAPEDARL